MSAVSFSTSYDSASAVLAATGEIDEPASGVLREDLEKFTESFSCDLVVDLSAVTYLPSAAIGVLVSARQRSRDAGRTLDLVAADGSIAQRVLTVCALPHRTG